MWWNPAEATEGERILPLHEAQILGDRVVVPVSPHVVVAGPETARIESGTSRRTRETYYGTTA